MSDRTLQLVRPLVAFDLETTGLNVSEDRIVEISCIKLMPDGSRQVRTRRLNPTIAISAAATAVHGISNADVAGEPTFSQVARSLIDFLSGSDLTGFNLETFDLPLLAKEFERADMKFPEPGTRVIDSRRIYLAKEPRTLAAAYSFYCQRSLEQAHTAQADAEAAADVLIGQIQRYDDLPATIDALDAFCHPVEPHWVDRDGKIQWQDDRVVIAFGKYRDRPLEEIVRSDPGYLRWVTTSNFPADVVAIIKNALDGRLPTQTPSA